MSSDHPRRVGGASARHSLRWRLPLAISAVLVFVLAVYAWAALRQIEATLARAGGDRAQAVAGQLANLLERTERQSRDDLRQLTDRPEFRAYLSNPVDASAAEALRSVLSASAAPLGRRVEIWGPSGPRLMDVVRTAPPGQNTPPIVLPEGARPTMSGLSPFQVANGTIFADVVEEIRADSTASAMHLGWVVVRSPITINPPGILARLVGPDAGVQVGNKTGDIWTDLSRVVPTPPINSTQNGVAVYRSADGVERLGALAEIRDTPWAVWVDFQRDVIVAPARVLLRQMTIIGILVVLAGAVLVRSVTRRITTPLAELTDAAEALATGEYARRVPASGRRDEINRLGDAFNVMADKVQQTHEGLEARIRERTAAIDALRESEARYRAIVEVAFDCVITIDTHGTVTEFNPAAERTFGYRRDEAVGRELASLIIPPGYREAHRRGLTHYLETGVGPLIGRLIEITAMRADGREFPAELAITAIDASGLPRMFTGVLRDITARKQSDAALIESERAFRSTFDDAPLGIAQVSVEGRWLRVNRRTTSLLGCDADELLNTPFLDIFASDDSPPVSLANMDAQPDREERVRRKDGRFVWVRLTVSALRDASGTPRHFIVIMEDVSERRQLEDRLRQSEKMEAIGQLAGGVAHDFNNLLTAILGYAQLVADTLDADDPRRDDVQEIVKAAERSAALTGQLLAFSRKQVLVPTVLDLNALIGDTADMLRRVIGEHLDLVTTLAPDLEPVCADVNQLEQIVINLAVNARDAMPEGGQLTMETANVELGEVSGAHPTVIAPGRYVMLAVRDTGVGMDPETQRRLFEPFFTTKEQGRGTGLGLATVYGIVKQSGGYIWVYSEPNHGTVFKVYLPSAAGAIVAEPRTVATASHDGTETILLVEDERAVRVMTRIILERSGYHVLEAATPEEARDLFRDHGDTIDLLITDVVMPGSHGPVLYGHLSAVRPSLNVLYMSGYTDTEIVHAGRLDPGVNFIEKPFTARSLTGKIREILDR